MVDSSSGKISLGAWIFLTVLLIITVTVISTAINASKSQQTTVSAPQNDPQALSTCTAPYTSERDSANITLQHTYVGQDLTPVYQALTDSANGLASCHKQYGN